jgi:hypothetical protein
VFSQSQYPLSLSLTPQCSAPFALCQLLSAVCSVQSVTISIVSLPHSAVFRSVRCLSVAVCSMQRSVSHNIHCLPPSLHSVLLLSLSVSCCLQYAVFSQSQCPLSPSLTPQCSAPFALCQLLSAVSIFFLPERL